jgi:hypothetical protein
MFVRSSLSTSLLGIAMLLGILAVIILPADAQTSGKSPLQVQASLVTAGTFSLGEPIVLKYTIRNTSSEEAHTYMGVDQSGWITNTVTDAQRHTSLIQEERFRHQKGGSHINGVSLSPMSSATGYMVVNSSTAIRVAGKYTFAVHMRLPYALGAQAEEVTPDKYEASGNVTISDFIFLIGVTPRDPQRLKQAAQTLREAVEDAKMRDWSAAAVEALFSMPEADVLSIWQALVSDPGTPRYALGFAADQLARLHTVAASDLVAQMRWEPAQVVKAGEPPIGATALEDMARLGDAKVKKHIADLYAAHEESHSYSLDVAD